MAQERRGSKCTADKATKQVDEAAGVERRLRDICFRKNPQAVEINSRLDFRLICPINACIRSWDWQDQRGVGAWMTRSDRPQHGARFESP